MPVVEQGEHSSDGCSACGGRSLAPHMRVAGASGDEGLIPTTDRFGTALADIVRCTACGHMQLETFPPEEELENAYEDAESYDYVAEEAGQRATADTILDEIEKHVRPGRFLDLGCWVGFTASQASKRGWTATGVEPSAFAARFAREETGIEVVNAGLFDADLEPGAFDAIFLGDVIEHLLDPGAALERIDGLLAPGGILAMALPDAGSRLARAMGKRWWSVIPTHVQYFTRASMATLLGRSGFEVVGVSTSPKIFTVGYYLDRISGYSRALGGGLVRAAKRMGVDRRPWGPDFRDRMLVIARRADGS